MTNTPTFSQEYLKSILHYNPDTGVFTRLVSVSNSAQKGSIAGHNKHLSYGRVNVNKKPYASHRLAWFYMTGEWPKEQIDHINQIKSDNSWCNLRECSNAQNNFNRPIPKHNKSGYKGVSWREDRKKWQSIIKFNGKSIYLGNFTDINLAVLAYNNKAVELFGEFAHLNNIARGF